MSLRLFVLCCLVMITASCEDKKSSRENTAEPNPKTEEPRLDAESIPDSLTEEPEEEPEVTEAQKPQGPLIVQEEFIPFILEYGKENRENRIRIKTRFGNIDVQLFMDTPLHRGNFIFLVKNDYFDNTFFHRVADGFVVQGGNSDTPSTNRKRHYIGDYLIPSEFEAGHRHVRGAFSAAKYAEQNVAKASSPYEFFIVQSENGAHHLDNDHTVFGRVISGMDVVDEISKVPTDPSEWPLRNIHLEVELLE